MCAYPFPHYADCIGLLSISLSLSAYHTTLLPNYYYYYVALFIALSMMIVHNQLRSLSLSLSFCGSAIGVLLLLLLLSCKKKNIIIIICQVIIIMW